MIYTKAPSPIQRLVTGQGSEEWLPFFFLFKGANARWQNAFICIQRAIRPAISLQSTEPEARVWWLAILNLQINIIENYGKRKVLFLLWRHLTGHSKLASMKVWAFCFVSKHDKAISLWFTVLQSLACLSLSEKCMFPVQRPLIRCTTALTFFSSFFFGMRTQQAGFSFKQKGRTESESVKAAPAVDCCFAATLVNEPAATLQILPHWPDELTATRTCPLLCYPAKETVG